MDQPTPQQPAGTAGFGAGRTGPGGEPTRGRFPLLDRVSYPADLRNLSIEQLRQLAEELRAET
ncbi:hypothetical protein, partial [Nguyenibacter vanlangensis]